MNTESQTEMRRPVSLGMTAPGRQNLWMLIWSAMLAAAWLTPNHYLPWSGFHSDATSAAAWLMAAAVIWWRDKQPADWDVFSVGLLAVACIPWLQYGMGVLPWAGQAGIASLYLLGFALAYQLGRGWERGASGQMAGGLFMAVAIGSLWSVGLQLNALLDLASPTEISFWTVEQSGPRPYANIGQPNQLASLLLWGVLAALWAYEAGKIRGAAAVVMAAFLLYGISLTQSRTAWVALSLLLVVIWLGRRRWSSKCLPWTATVLYVVFWFYPWLTAALVSGLGLDAGSDFIRRITSNEARQFVYSTFLQASLKQPWLGYGWADLGKAHLSVALEDPSLDLLFAHTHNLFLDLVLWLGWPLGLLLSGTLIWWFMQQRDALTDPRRLMLGMFVLVIGVHAMLELPHQYAYFLLPTGAVMGALGGEHQAHFRWKTGKAPLLLVWLLAAGMFALVVKDYLQVEESVRRQRFVDAGIITATKLEPPDVVLLTQWREIMRLMQFKPHTGMTQQDMEWLIAVVRTYPSIGTRLKAATALGLNERPKEAAEWLEALCKVKQQNTCEQIETVWQESVKQLPSLATVPWPRNSR